MRVLLSIMVCSILTAAAGSAAAASFDCKKARTTAEKLICATPELSRADEELGRQYKAARAATRDAKELRETQQRWIRTRRDTCADAACMLAAYRRRIPELKAMARPGGRTGDYSVGDNDLEILEIAPGVLRFHLLALYPHGDEVNTGEICGEVTIKGGKGTYHGENDCQLDWAFQKDGSLTINQKGEGDCDFGANVTASGTYKKDRSDAPALSLCY
jgi:uncharacterized protein